MELGNLVFGNSRGNVPVPRGMGYEEHLFRLFEAYAPNRNNGWREYGEDFENDTFAVMRYYWGDCTCGWDDFEESHTELDQVSCRPDCFSHTARRLSAQIDAEARLGSSWEQACEKYLRPEYEARGWDTTSPGWWHGYMTRCDCDYEERADAVLEEYAKEFGYKGHKPDCPLVKPNFLYKPTGFSIQWYKYPLRDSYMSEQISVEEFAAMIDACIASLEVAHDDW